MAKWAKMTSQIGNMYLRLDKDLDKSVPTPIILKIFLKHSPMHSGRLRLNPTTCELVVGRLHSSHIE